MILDKPPDIDISDAPPSYDDVSRLGHRQGSQQVRGSAYATSGTLPEQHRLLTPVSTSTNAYTDEKALYRDSTYSSPSTPIHGPIASSSRLSLPPSSPTSASRLRRPKPAPISTRSTAASSGWFSSSSTAKAQADVHETVVGLIRGLVLQPPASTNAGSTPEASQGVLASCASACAAHGLSLGTVLQERSVEGHTPLYWAIVKGRPPRQMEDDDPDSLVFQLLQYLSTPSPGAAAITGGVMGMVPGTYADLRAACLAAADNAILQRIRRTAPVARIALQGADRGLLAGSGSPDHVINLDDESTERFVYADTVDVEEGPASVSGTQNGVEDDAGSFRVRVALEMFQRRMRVVGSVGAEFVARGRLWTLTFFVVPPNDTPLPSPSPSPSASTILSYYMFPKSSVSPQEQPSMPPIPAAALAAARTRRLAPGTWAVCLSLSQAEGGGAQCWVDARLVVPDPRVLFLQAQAQAHAEARRREREQAREREREIQRERTLPSSPRSPASPAAPAAPPKGEEWDQERSKKARSWDQDRDRDRKLDPTDPLFDFIPPTPPNELVAGPSESSSGWNPSIAAPTPGPSGSSPSRRSPSLPPPPPRHPSSSSSLPLSPYSRQYTSSSVSSNSSSAAFSLRNAGALTLSNLRSALTPSSPAPLSTSPRAPKNSKYKPKPTIALRLSSSSSPLLPQPFPLPLNTPFPPFSTAEAPARSSKLSKKDVRALEARDRRARAGKENKKERGERERLADSVALAGLEESLMAGELVYDGTAYIAPDGILRGTLEVRLAKPDTGCIIC